MWSPRGSAPTDLELQLHGLTEFEVVFGGYLAYLRYTSKQRCIRKNTLAIVELEI